MSADCLFCRIGRKEIPAKLVYEDGEVFAFEFSVLRMTWVCLDMVLGK